MTTATVDDTLDEVDAGPFRCSTASAARHEPMFATASRVDRWLLVEQTGPWGPESVPAGRMDPRALETVTRLANEFRARLLLIRRPSVAAKPGPEEQSGVTVFLADSRIGHEWLVSRVVADADELARLEPPSRDPSWQVETEPLYLVCTHGRHDPCCALFGRPVAGALCGREPGRTWESSHVGGDRFGANVVVLPQGFYLGRVIPGRVDEVVDAVRERRIPLALLRGRSSLAMPAQAAQHFARHREADASGQDVAVGDGFDDLRPLAVTAVNETDVRVELAAPAGRVAVTVRRERSDTPARLTCHAPEPKLFPGFTLVGIEDLPG